MIVDAYALSMNKDYFKKRYDKEAKTNEIYEVQCERIV